ncbi:MAG: hypothetical protein JW973_05380 [Bacteroidales bacterium]|nr:hypothetical protein [Bacteroidales bacterium]
MVILLYEPKELYAQLNFTQSFALPDNAITINTAENGEEYSEVIYPELRRTNKPGTPDLPVKYVQFLLPPGMTAKNVIINSVKYEAIKLNKKVKPVQIPIPTSLNYKLPDFMNPDAVIYESDSPYPNRYC